MPIPIESVGISAVSGGTFVWFLMKIVPIIMKKINGNSRNSNNDKPGKAEICRERGDKIVEHDTVIKQLCAIQEEHKEQTETARKENREDHQRIFDKLDELK